MSIARSVYLEEVHALSEAVSLPRVGSDTAPVINPGAAVLRRGATIAGLVMLETFVRERTEEILKELQNWPAQYENLPKRFRDRATIESLPNIEKYARLLKRQQGDYEDEILTQITKMASMSPPEFEFTKYIAGDYTGNLSVKGTTDLLKVFQIKKPWESMKSLGSDVGFGVPSIREILRAIISNRHKSAHVARYSPPAGDVIDLPKNLTLIGICFDAALSASIRVALSNWQIWISDRFDWRSFLEVYFVVPNGSKLRIIKKDAKRATKVVDKFSEVKPTLPSRPEGITRLLVIRAEDQIPKEWDVT